MTRQLQFLALPLIRTLAACTGGGERHCQHARATRYSRYNADTDADPQAGRATAVRALQA